ncbi:MAG: endonuclease [Pseudomonadota bacterium]
MSQKQTLNSIALAVVLSMAVFVVAFALFWVLAEYRFMSSVFLAFLVSFFTGIVLLIGFGSSAAMPAPAVARAPAPSAPPTPAPAPEPVAVDDTAAREAAEFRAAAEAETAKLKAAEEAAAARVAEAARIKAEEEAAAEAEEARAKAEADAAAAAAATESTPDYDGDGIKEGTDEGTRPAGLDAPRDGKADNLKEIKGIGPKLEKLCNRLGFWHFDQVANWTSDEVAWVDANLEGFKGRVTRDKWVDQAKVLAAGGETEFSKRVEDGDVY